MHLLAIERKEREQELLAYADSLPGNPIRQFQVYEELREGFEHKETIMLSEHLEEKAVKHLKEVVSEIPDENTLQEFISEAVGGRVEDLRIITEIEERVETPEVIGQVQTPIEDRIDEVRATVEQQLVENIIADPTVLTESDLVSDSIHNTTSIADVEVIHELEQILESTPEVSPEIIETVHQIEEQVIEQFVETVTQDPQHALVPVPEIIETLVELQQEQPPAVDATLQVAIQAEVEVIQEYVEKEADNPQTLETIVAQIEDSPVVAQTVAQVGGTQFNQTLSQTAQEVTATAQTQQTLLKETVAQVEQEIFTGTESGQTVIETLPESVQEEIQQVQQQVPIQQLPQVEVTVQTSVEIRTQPQETAPTAPSAPAETSAPVEAPSTSTTTQEQTQPAPAVEQPQAPAVPGL